jgi:fatty acid desaturase
VGNVRKLLPPDELLELTRLDPLRSGWAIAQSIGLLALVTVLQAILRLRAICDHRVVTDFSAPLSAARTNLAGPLSRFLLFPHDVNYHVEHHLYPAVPHYRLRALHRALSGRGALAGAEVRKLGDPFGQVFAERVSAASAA